MGTVFKLELKAILRSKTFALLAMAAVGWMLAFPHVVHGDGTAAGLRELDIHYSLGGVFALLVVTLVAAATGSVAHERATHRLQLTLVRPVSTFSVALGKTLALALSGAAILVLAAGVLACRVDLSAPCSHVLSPILPSAEAEARTMYDAYMADTNTPDAVRHASRSVVLRLLTQRARDHYQTVPTNDCVAWRFACPGDPADLAARFRFTNAYELRQDVRGVFRCGNRSGAVSNLTQAVLTVPLAHSAVNPVSDGTLVFENRGTSALMLRPRRDVNLLVRGDAFCWNLVRTLVELAAVLTLVIAFGIFLGSALGRPVALFTALVTLLLSEMSPSVIEQYPDELEGSAADRIGLVLTRLAHDVTRPVSSLAPLESLAKDECVEPREVARAVALDLFALPLVLLALAAFALPRKPSGT